MSDSFTDVTHESWFSRLGEAIKGVIVGLVLFLAAFPLLFWNEGRAVHTARSLEEGEAAVVSAAADRVDPAHEGRLVHVSGPAATTEVLFDPEFGVSVNALRLRRVVETYQWQEVKTTQTQSQLGGGQRTETRYEYRKVWSADLIDSSRFKEQDGHRNPSARPFPAVAKTARQVKLGAFDLPPSLVDKITSEEPLPLGEEAVDQLPATVRQQFQIQGDQLYRGTDPAAPQVGDVRIEFRVVRPTAVSVVAQQRGTTFQPYQAAAGSALELLQVGTHSAREMFATEQAGNTLLTWALRLVGVVVMGVGIYLVVRPVAVVADVIPLLGSLLAMGLGLFALVTALALSLTTIAIGWLYYRPLLGVGLLVVAAGGLALLYLAGKGRRAAAPAPVKEAAAPVSLGA